MNYVGIYDYFSGRYELTERNSLRNAPPSVVQAVPSPFSFIFYTLYTCRSCEYTGPSLGIYIAKTVGNKTGSRSSACDMTSNLDDSSSEGGGRVINKGGRGHWLNSDHLVIYPLVIYARSVLWLFNNQKTSASPLTIYWGSDVRFMTFVNVIY